MPTSALADLMAHAAAAFLASLTPEEHAAATREFGDTAERQRWYYTPNVRPGVSLIELGPAQRQFARQLLRAGMSEGGYNTAAAIISLEAILAARENWPASQYAGYAGPTTSVNRDPDMQFLCVFGEPGDPQHWGWAFGGHHLSVHHTIVGGRVARGTPSFLGSNPAKSPLGAGYFLQPLAPEQDLGFALLHRLTGEQRARAILGPQAPSDLMQGSRAVLVDDAMPLPLAQLTDVPAMAELQQMVYGMYAHTALTEQQLKPLRFRLAEPAGLPLASCDAAQQQAAEELIKRYLDRLPPQLAAAEWQRVAPTLAATHFAWAGSTTPGASHYYRLHGTALLIEYDNPDADGNHVHSVWRDPAGDFGADLLGAHYAAAH